MTRPEGVLFFGLAALFRLARNLRRERRLAPTCHELYWLAGLPGGLRPLLRLALDLLRLAVSQHLLRQVGGRSRHLEAAALYYLRRFVEDYSIGFLALVAAAGLARRRTTGGGGICSRCSRWCAVVFAAYVIKVGGDFMGLYRFILPILPLGAVCVQEAVRTLADAAVALRDPRRCCTAAGIAAFAAFVAGSLQVSRKAAAGGSDQGIDSPGYLKHYVEERVPIGLWMARHVRPEHLASVGGAGVIPYYSGIRAFDCFGLVDQTIAHDPAMTVRPAAGSPEVGLVRVPVLAPPDHHHARLLPERALQPRRRRSGAATATNG